MAKILLIDDEALVQKALGYVLKNAGHTVHIASDGAEGIRKMTETSPDLIITDIVMPKQEGIETIMAIRKVNATIPVIAISGGGRVGSLDFLKTAMVFGATKIIRKPFGAAVLLAAVDECLATAPIAAGQ